MVPARSDQASYRTPVISVTECVDVRVTCDRAPGWLQVTQHELEQRTLACKAQHSTAQHSTAQHSTAQHSTAQHASAQAQMRVAGDMQCGIHTPGQAVARAAPNQPRETRLSQSLLNMLSNIAQRSPPCPSIGLKPTKFLRTHNNDVGNIMTSPA